MADKKRNEDGGPVYPTMTSSGISLREHYAGLAMQAIIIADPDDQLHYEDFADSACQQADAMIAALSNSDTDGE